MLKYYKAFQCTQENYVLFLGLLELGGTSGRRCWTRWQRYILKYLEKKNLLLSEYNRLNSIFGWTDSVWRLIPEVSFSFSCDSYKMSETLMRKTWQKVIPLPYRFVKVWGYCLYLLLFFSSHCRRTRNVFLIPWSFKFSWRWDLST